MKEYCNPQCQAYECFESECFYGNDILVEPVEVEVMKSNNVWVKATIVGESNEDYIIDEPNITMPGSVIVRMKKGTRMIR